MILYVLLVCGMVLVLFFVISDFPCVRMHRPRYITLLNHLTSKFDQHVTFLSCVNETLWRVFLLYNEQCGNAGIFSDNQVCTYSMSLTYPFRKVKILSFVPFVIMLLSNVAPTQMLMSYVY